MSTVWEISRDEGVTYNDVETDPSLYSGQTGAALTISSVPDTLDNYYYRLRVETDSCSSQYSDPAILRVEGPLAFTLQPTDVSACAGSLASLCLLFRSAFQMIVISLCESVFPEAVIPFWHPGGGGFCHLGYTMASHESSRNDICWS